MEVAVRLEFHKSGYADYLSTSIEYVKQWGVFATYCVLGYRPLSQSRLLGYEGNSARNCNQSKAATTNSSTGFQHSVFGWFRQLSFDDQRLIQIPHK